MAAAVDSFHTLSHFDNYTNYRGSKNDMNLMCKELERLKSFDNWPLTFIDPKTLAKSGFYYTKKNDLVRCAFCKVVIMKWERNDDVMTEHRRWSERCPMVCGMYCGNISIDGDCSMSALPESVDYQRYCGVEVRPNSYSELEMVNLDRPRSSPRYPDFKSSESRLKSFTEWPSSIKQKPDQLAAAGFYYTGRGDRTICFYCGLGLKDWSDDDDPFEEHARWYSRCGYIQSQKGREYCSEVSSRQRLFLTSEEMAALETPSSSNKTSNSNTFSSGSGVPKRENKVIDMNKYTNRIKKAPILLCKICNMQERNILFLPCRHILVCEDCASSLTTCLVCKTVLEAAVLHKIVMKMT